jgi:hypothetical protein
VTLAPTWPTTSLSVNDGSACSAVLWPSAMGGFSPELSRRGWLCCSSRMEADRRQVPKPNADERATLTGFGDRRGHTSK